MRKILISIKKEYVDKIISGEKKFEYRTRVAKEVINKIIIYCTMPTKKVVAEAEIVEILQLSKEDMWEETKDYAGITQESFMDYSKNSEIAYAYKLGKITVFTEEKELLDYGVTYAPQSFVYIN